MFNKNYSLNKLIQQSINKGRRSQREEAVVKEFFKALKEQCPEGECHKFPFKKYISDNEDFVPALVGILKNPGTRTALLAGCGSGKTFVITHDLAIALKKLGKAILLLTPNSIQTDQNGRSFYTDPDTGKEINVIAINANNKNDIKIEPGRVYSIVYDSANSRFETIPADILKDVVIVVDEAHQLESAKDYRGLATKQIKKMVEITCAFGGNAIYMTGTPARIMGYKFDHLVDCYRVDENGNRVSEINVNKLHLFRNASSKNKFAVLIAYQIINMVNDGKIPFVRINSKKIIRQVQAILASYGLRGAAITSDNKGRTMEEYTDDYGFTHTEFKYASNEYKTIIEEDALTNMDYFLVTSVLEVGTSIKGVKDDEGRIWQNPKLVPVFACNNPNAFDLDNITQFLARPRYQLDEAYILINNQEDNTPDVEPTLADCILSVAKDAVDALEAEKIAGQGRLSMPTLEGKTAEGLLCTNELGIRSICVSEIVSEGVVKFYSQVAHKSASLASFLSGYFCIPCEDHVVASRLDIKMVETETVDPKVRELVNKAIAEDETFLDAIVNDKLNMYATQIRPLVGGKKVLQNIKDLYVSNQFDTEQIGNIAVSMVENRRVVAVNKNGEIVNPKTFPVDDLLRALSNLKMGIKAETALEQYFNDFKDNGDYADSSILSMIENSTLKDKFIYYIGTELGFKKLEWLFKIWTEANGLLTWEKACNVVASQEVKDLYHVHRTIYNIKLNHIEYENDFKKYTDAVQQFRLESGAEYDTLRRFTEGFEYVDEDYADETDEEIRKKHTRKHMVGGFNNKIVSMYDCEQIALQFNDAKYKMRDKCKRIRPYTAKEIWMGIKTLYKTYPVPDSDGNIVEGKYLIKGLRKSIRKTFGDKVIDEGSFFYEVNRVLNDKDISYEFKIRVLSNAKKDLVNLGYTDERALAVCNSIVEALTNGEEIPFDDVQKGPGYQDGSFGVIAGVAKAIPERKALTMEEAAKLIACGIRDNFDARVKEIDLLLADTKELFYSLVDKYLNFCIELPGYISKFDKRSFPTDILNLPDEEFDAAKAVYEKAAMFHQFFWNGNWYDRPADVPNQDEVDPRATVLWRTDKDVYRGAILNLAGGTYV